jgi:hypothetical protein
MAIVVGVWRQTSKSIQTRYKRNSLHSPNLAIVSKKPAVDLAKITCESRLSLFGIEGVLVHDQASCRWFRFQPRFPVASEA